MRLSHLVLLATYLALIGAMPDRAHGEETTPLFKPVCIEAQLSAQEVRPGGEVALTLKFRNEGNAPSPGDCYIFVHLEHPDKDCRHIVFQADHMPAIPTSAWEAGMEIVDGAYSLDFPQGIAEGKYFLHIGIYNDRGRFCDQYPAEIEVSKGAPDLVAVPPKMTAEEVSRRSEALRSGIADSVVIEDETLRFAISRSKGTWRLRDKRSDEVWHSNPAHEGLGEVRLSNGERTVVARLAVVEMLATGGRRINVVCRPASDHPHPNPLPQRARGSGAPSPSEGEGWGEGDPGATIGVWIELLPDGKGLKFSYAVDGRGDPSTVAQDGRPLPEDGRPLKASPTDVLGEWKVEAVRLLDKSLWATDTEGGYLAVPYRLGLMIPAGEGLTTLNRYTAYSNFRSYSMAMAGVVKNGSAMLVWWDDPYADLEVERSWPDMPNVPGHGMVSVSLELQRTARSFVLRPLGKGGYSEIAHAYRDAAKEKGFLSTLQDKIEARPQVEKIIGAADFKPFVLSRRLAGTRWNQSTEDRVDFGYTFEECARIAEHLRADVGIDKAMMVLAGWIHRGYDNQHPDILPAAPECGGNDGLIDCGKRVKALDYLFGLHDNYQDMYKDAPSWDESFLMKHVDGSPAMGGVWAGGQAYVTCSKKALELAKRDQNLPEVKRLFDPTIYFIDTTFAAGLQECFSEDHPISRTDDMRWKTALSNYARETFGLLGSEEGQEWAVPCADYFEGILSHKTQRPEREIVIPLFEMVYGDCINLYTHQGDRASASRPEYVLDHILYAEMPVYQFGAHLYFEQAGAGNVEGFSFADLESSPLNETDRFIKNTYEVLSPLARLTAFTTMTSHEFLTPDRSVERTRFGDVMVTVNYGDQPYRTKNAVLPKYGFLIESPTYVAFYATEHAGRKLDQPTMMTARSLDGKPLSQSADVRVYRAFGDRIGPMGLMGPM